MDKLTIKALKTRYPNIKKFDTNFFLVKNGKFKYTNLQEAKTSPLAQSLLTLPYVKTILIAENFIAIEISSDKNWEEVESTIINTISQHIKEEKPIVLDQPKVFPIDVYSEMDTGPGTLKFVCGKKLVFERVQFDFNKDFDNSPLAIALFKFPYVKRVVFENNYVIITKGGAVEWSEVTPELRDFIRQYLMKGKPVMDDLELPY